MFCVTRVLNIILVILGSHLLLDWFFIDFLSLWPPPERASGAAKIRPQALRSSKQLQNDSCSKLFVRLSRGRSARGDPASGLRATVVPLSGRLWRRWREQPRNAPDAPELLKASKRLLFNVFRKGFRVRIFGLLWGSHFCVLLTHVMRRTS